MRLVNDVPVKLEGNPLCPISRGRLCAKGQAALESYFDPDRLTGPARRTGTGRKGEWQRIEWDAAIALLASKLQPAASPGRILAVASEEHGPLADAWTHFWTAAGARLRWTPAAAAPRLRDAFASLTGVDADPLFDLEHATYVLSFGAPITEDWLSPVWTQRSYGRLRRGSPQERGRLVQIDARRSMTARKADEWLAMPADRQAALAYGIAAVLLREGRTARDTFGASIGNIPDFERSVVARYTPDDVAAVTGVPVVTVLRLARDLVASPRPLVTVATDADPSLIEAVMSLNTLVGALDRPGGLFAAVGPKATTEPDRAQASQEDLSSTRVVALRDASRAAFAVDAGRPVRGRGARGIRGELFAVSRRGRPGRRPLDAHAHAARELARRRAARGHPRRADRLVPARRPCATGYTRCGRAAEDDRHRSRPGCRGVVQLEHVGRPRQRRSRATRT